MDFGRPSPARATDRLVFLPPFPPEAERWAFTAELSIKTCSGGPPACASAWNKSTQTPLAASGHSGCRGFSSARIPPERRSSDRLKALMNRDHFWLTDDQFSKIEPHLPTDTRGKARVDDRRVIGGIINVLRRASRWRERSRTA
jgi:hypothetical protein